MAAQSQQSTFSTISVNFSSCSVSPQEQSVIDLTAHLEEIDGTPFACGGYADLYRYRCCTSILGPDAQNAVYAVKAPRSKFVLCDRRKAIAKMAREICVWSSLKHENVLKLHGMLYRNNNALPSLVADFMEMGTAYQFIKNCPDADLINLILQVASGLSYMHDREITHGDIKGDNILVGGDRIARVADFGLSRMLGSDGLPSEVTTTDANRSHRWHAVEYFNFETPARTTGPTKPADVWSFGCTVLQLFSGNIPFYDAVEGEVAIRLSRGELPKFPPNSWKPHFEKIRPGIVAFCRFCWVKNPDVRPQMKVLEELACSDFWEETCGASARQEMPFPSQTVPASPSQESPNPDQNIRRESSPANASPLDGFRSRASSEATVVGSPPADEDKDIKFPIVEPPEEVSPPPSPQEVPANEPETATANSMGPEGSIPSPPPPSLAEILNDRGITPQEVLNEFAMATHRFAIQYVEGESTGPPNLRTHAMICKVNNEVYGVGVVPGKKKQAKLKAALIALRRLWLENPDLLGHFRYLPILKAYVEENNLTARVTWDRQSGPSPGDQTRWEHRATFIYDGNVVAVGTGVTAGIAEEHAARKVSVEWTEGIGSAA